MGWRGRRAAFKLPGVYKIGVVVDGVEYVYVGQSTSIGDRWGGHLADLVAGTHHAPRLQAAWDKIGPDGFTFRVLEVVDAAPRLMRAALLSCERKWMRAYPVGRLLNKKV